MKLHLHNLMESCTKVKNPFIVTNYALCKSMFTNKEPHSYNFILNSYAHCAIGINEKVNEWCIHIIFLMSFSINFECYLISYIINRKIEQGHQTQKSTIAQMYYYFYH